MDNYRQGHLHGDRIAKKTCTLDATHTETEDIPIDLVNGHDWDSDFTITPATESTNSKKAILCKLNKAHTKDEEFTGVYAFGTDGLDFELISINGETDNAYRVSRSTATGDIVIPAFYRPDATSQYLPVTEIASFGGSTTTPNTSVTGITFAEGNQLTAINQLVFCKKQTTK